MEIGTSDDAAGKEEGTEEDDDYEDNRSSEQARAPHTHRTDMNKEN
jgi:hypothetical protein